MDVGNYQLTVSEGGCVDMPAVITLTDPTFTVAYAFTDPSSCGVADGEILISSLTANTAYEVSYDQGGTVTGPLIFTASATGEILLSGLSTGEYELLVSYLNCVESRTVVLNCNSTLACFEIPSYFTPNSDSYHDTWKLDFENQGSCTGVIYIFDRYGKLLKTMDIRSGWDGNYNNNPMPSSDYWYLIEYIESDLSIRLNGHFTLKR
ncbi:T9SS type B sorting domain-containing protein [Nonlabens sp. Asnod3-A02]|uniref:T9SS type B sorting domain-containing protein n=1 Tax=Nonlabens sp. Asnod3-A02 TaxID=3160579 RepID=UPI0038675B64